MYDKINTIHDVLRERYVYGAELVGRYGFPQLPVCNPNLSGAVAVPFNLARKEKNPRKAVCHFFIDDYQFECYWNNPEKYRGILENFRYICTPDFSLYDGLPLALKIWQTYRSRAIAWMMHDTHLPIIPTVSWGSPDTWEYCFDGLPTGGTLAVSTNGCFRGDGRACFVAGYQEMIRRLRPDKMVVVGYLMPEIDAAPVSVVYLESYLQQSGIRRER